MYGPLSKTAFFWSQSDKTRLGRGWVEVRFDWVCAMQDVQAWGGWMRLDACKWSPFVCMCLVGCE